jgi:excisionase family DNA binding protein
MKKYEKEIMTVKDLAEYLSCSEGHIYNLRCRGEIPFKKITGIGLRFIKSDIENWIYEQSGEES